LVDLFREVAGRLIVVEIEAYPGFCGMFFVYGNRTIDENVVY
jgi:hypothetical protein